MRKVTFLLAMGLLGTSLLFPRLAHAKWDPNKRYNSGTEAILDGAPAGAKVKLTDGTTGIMSAQAVEDVRRLKRQGAFEGVTFERSSTATTTETNQAVESTEFAPDTLPNTGGEPLLMASLGLLVAGSGLLLRRQLS